MPSEGGGGDGCGVLAGEAGAAARDPVTERAKDMESLTAIDLLPVDVLRAFAFLRRAHPFCRRPPKR